MQHLNLFGPWLMKNSTKLSPHTRQLMSYMSINCPALSSHNRNGEQTIQLSNCYPPFPLFSSSSSLYTLPHQHQNFSERPSTSSGSVRRWTPRIRF